MYEQSFSYLADLLVRFIKDHHPTPGERHYVQFEDEQGVAALSNALADRAEQRFVQSEFFSAPLLTNGEVDVIVAGSHNAQAAFLTKLRNETASQRGAFNNKALLIIDHTGLDSIVSGCESLAKENRPLHADSLKQEIRTDIAKSPLGEKTKVALGHLLEDLRQTTHEDTSSVFAYLPFMKILAQGRVDVPDWNNLGLFFDEELEAVPIKKVRGRITANQEFFSAVQNSHQYGNPDEDLEKTFTQAGIAALKQDSWEKTPYSKVAKWHEAKSSYTPAGFVNVDTTELPWGPEIWERREGDTAAASRARHLVIFNTALEESIALSLVFDATVKNSAIQLAKDSNLETTGKGKTLNVTVKNCSSRCVIDQVKYKESKGGATIFNIAVVPFESRILRDHRTTFLVNGAPRSRRLRLYEEGLLVINGRAETETRSELSKDGQEFTISGEEKTLISTDNADPDREITFNLVYKGIEVPCELYRERSKPTRISGIRIWKWKREKGKSFEYLGENKLVFGSDEYFTEIMRTNRFLEYERSIVEEHYNDCFWYLDKQGLAPKHLDVDSSLLSAFQRLVRYYHKSSVLPSLAHVDTELKQLMEEYVAEFQKLLESIPPDDLIKESDSNLLRVGTIEQSSGERRILLTPLHPLMVAYQLQLLGEAGSEVIPEEVLKCLNPAALVPYLNDPTDSQIKLCPVSDCELPEWMVYRPHNTFNRGWRNEYVEGLIAEKIADYTRHFPYLFTGASQAPIRINLVNMGDCTDALKGVIKYFLRAIGSTAGDAGNVTPIELHIYGSDAHANKFEAFARYATPNQIEQDFEIKITAGDCSSADVLAILHEKLHFYLKPADASPGYSHITFFRFDQGSLEWIYHKMDSIRTGASLQGLASAIPSVFRQSQYLTGYGTKDYPAEPSQLLQFSEKYNALARVAFTQQPYSNTEATFAALQAEQKKQLDHLYDVSNWVTLIDPKVDLNFFKMHETANDLVIIHYSDQYNNTSGYDAITVTRKSNQYRAIIREFLNTRHEESTAETELALINMFNALNGDWLLRLIAGRRHFPKEKVSILSAVRTMLAFLEHPEITWVPLSLEEVLRVSGSVGLKQGEGLFSVKNLGQKGSYCDDLLLAGVEASNEGVRIHLLPVEVKIGQNKSGVIQKAKEQGLHTACLLREFLTPAPDCFRARFYRSFFAKMILVAAEKMDLYDVFPEGKWDRITHDSRAALLSNEYELSWDLENGLAKCCVLAFRDECFQRTAKVEDNVLVLDLPDEDGHKNLLKTVVDLSALYESPGSTMDERLLLRNFYESTTPSRETPVEGGPEAGKQECVTQEKVQEVRDLPGETPAKTVPTSTAGMKIIFGHEVNYQEPVCWYPNDTDKVMHTNTGIIGTMGTGKTQFTKSLVAQMVWESKNNVNGTPLGFLIFDYKGDYIKDDFVQATGAKVYDLHRLPYNPLSLTVGGKHQPMLPLHTANAIKESISTAFGLGVVQQQRLRDMIMEAYALKGIDKADARTWSGEAPTIADMCRIYLEADDTKPDSLYAAIDNLHQFEIFEPRSADTFSLWNLLDGVVVINLSGYDQDIQNLVVAITLDLFYSQMQKAGHSTIQDSLRELRKMVLVDEADNFLSQDFASLRKILKEGREFGVGTILSTQFLGHFSTGENEYANYVFTWIVHRVTDLTAKAVPVIFGAQSKDIVSHILSQGTTLSKHFSLVSAARDKPVLIRDRAFWEMPRHHEDRK